MKFRNPFGPLDRGLTRLYAFSQSMAEGRTEYGNHEQRTLGVPEEKANLVSSATGVGDWHLPVLDLDVPHRLVPSTTEGHSHLYIDVAVPWDKYVRLLEAMADAGILEHGYVSASIDKGATMVRLPGQLKPLAVGDYVRVNEDIPSTNRGGSTGVVASIADEDAFGLTVRVRFEDGVKFWFAPEELTRTTLDLTAPIF